MPGPIFHISTVERIMLHAYRRGSEERGAPCRFTQLHRDKEGVLQVTARIRPTKPAVSVQITL